jgi:alkylhydroperoxidase/carboxymuconolactone decarboxylase family protein YurZ
MISLTPNLNSLFIEFAKNSLENITLSDRERVLSVLGVAITLEDNNSIKQAIVAAKQVGISNEEIGHISSLVIAMRGLKIAGLGVAIPTPSHAPSSNGQSAQSTCCR